MKQRVPSNVRGVLIRLVAAAIFLLFFLLYATLLGLAVCVPAHP